MITLLPLSRNVKTELYHNKGKHCKQVHIGIVSYTYIITALTLTISWNHNFHFITSNKNGCLLNVPLFSYKYVCKSFINENMFNVRLHYIPSCINKQRYVSNLSLSMFHSFLIIFQSIQQ